MIETDITGAKRTSWEHYNPRDLLLRLMQEYPDANEKALARYMCECVLGDDRDCLLPILLYFIRNNMRSLSEQQQAPMEREQRVTQKREQHEQRTAQASTRVTEHVRAEAEKMLLDLEMPNGKQLRDCTGPECRHFGGWYQRLADKIGRRKVGDVLSEQEVRGLLKKGRATAHD